MIFYQFPLTQKSKFQGTSRRSVNLKICKKVGLVVKPKGKLEKLNTGLSMNK